MEVESIRRLLRRPAPADGVRVQGWLRTVRHGKQVSFLDVHDGSCMDGLQLVAGPETEGFESVVRQLSTGCAISAEGKLVDSPGQGQRVELHATRIELVGAVEDDYPLQKKRHSFEFLRTIAHLRPRTNTIGAVFRVRNAASMAIHDFFQREEFLYLHTPI
ncbi:MAG: OB-fold nucleic acid binding domain-containing protein, partial [Myxococcota bacterium]